MSRYRAVIVEATKIGLAGLGTKHVSVRPRTGGHFNNGQTERNELSGFGDEAEQTRRIEAAAEKLARKRAKALRLSQRSV